MITSTKGTEQNMNYIIKETQNVNSDREGESFTGSLTAAKRSASKNQAFHGTVLKIETESGALVAYKEGSAWVNV